GVFSLVRVDARELRLLLLVLLLLLPRKRRRRRILTHDVRADSRLDRARRSCRLSTGRAHMRRKQSLFVVAFLSSAASLAAADTPSEQMLDRLKGLAGTWEGTLEWSHGRTGTGPVKATYRRTGAGSAVVEDLVMGDGGEASMTSIYHLDGAELRMTHFC